MHTVGPVGSKPEIQIASNLDDAIELILKLVLRLIKQEGVKMSSIAVLSKNVGILERLKPALFANRILFSAALVTARGGDEKLAKSLDGSGSVCFTL
jgi:hypothetical protein